ISWSFMSCCKCRTAAGPYDAPPQSSGKSYALRLLQLTLLLDAFRDQRDSNSKQNHQRADRVDFRTDTEFHHAVDPERQGGVTNTGSELRNDEIIEREHERQQTTCYDSRHDQRQCDFEKHCRRGSAKILSSFLEMGIESFHTAHDHQRNIGGTEHNVR